MVLQIGTIWQVSCYIGNPFYKEVLKAFTIQMCVSSYVFTDEETCQIVLTAQKQDGGGRRGRTVGYECIAFTDVFVSFLNEAQWKSRQRCRQPAT